MPRLSAGRVQSVATRMIVERERARMKFRSATWWDLDGTFEADRRRGAPGQPFGATLVALGGHAGGHRAATSRRRASCRPAVRSGARRGRGHAAWPPGWPDQPFTVKSVTEKPLRRTPAPPFMTSTLQQEAGRKLRFGAQRTMQVAQRLYEQGWITYMRTDSTTLSDEALAAARAQAAAALRTRVRPRPAPPLRAEGQERPGGPRGHPPGRRVLPHPGRRPRASCPATRCGSTT